MEKEVSLYHQLVEHPFFLFVVGALLMTGFVFVLALWLMNHRERSSRKGSDKPNNPDGRER